MPTHPSQPNAAHSTADAGTNPIPPGRYDIVILGADRAARWAACEAASLGARVAWLVGDADGPPPAGVAAAVDVYRGAPHFIASDALHLAGRRLHFVRALIATGATPIVPPDSDIGAVPRLDAATPTDLASPPGRVAVIGAGATGCAAAQALARRGGRVTLFEAEGRVLPREAPEAAAAIHAALTADGVHVRTDHRVTTAVAKAGGWAFRGVTNAGTDSDESFDAGPFDKVVLAAGRRSDLGSLDLPAAAVESDGARLRLDERLRTTNPRVYAAGDAALDHPSTHGAMACTRVALRNALLDGRRRADVLTIPRVVFTVPQLASVGLLAHEPEAADVPLDTFVHRAEATAAPPNVSHASDEVGVVAFHLAAGTDVLLGATLVGPDAAAAIGELAHAIDAGITLAELGRAIRPPGVFADAVRAAADEAHHRRRSPGNRALATRWLAARRTWADRTAARG